MSNIWATRFANGPVMVGRGDAEWLNTHLGGVQAEMTRIETRMETSPAVMQDDFWPNSDSWLAQFRPYTVQTGTLFIPVKGLLLHGFGYQLFDWATGYDYLAKAFARGMADPNVERVALVIASGGGEVAGNFDLVDKMFATKTKPVQAFVNEAAYSAAYSIASVADTISMTRTAGVGSIGVVTSHTDVSKMMDERGIKITFIHAGDQKVAGNPYTALPDDVKARMQTRIDGLYDIFVATVARNLGIDEQVVRDTQARTYSADDAINLGLAHEVMPFDEAVAAFGGLNIETEEETMTKPVENEQAQAQATQAQLDAARAEGKAEGVAAERARISGILGSAEAANRREVAFHLALNTPQTVEDAVALLAITPEQGSAQPQGNGGNAFEEAMNQNNPNIQAEHEQSQEEANHQNDATSLIADYRAASGY